MILMSNSACVCVFFKPSVIKTILTFRFQNGCLKFTSGEVWLTQFSMVLLGLIDTFWREIPPAAAIVGRLVYYFAATDRSRL